MCAPSWLRGNARAGIRTSDVGDPLFPVRNLSGVRADAQVRLHYTHVSNPRANHLFHFQVMVMVFHWQAAARRVDTGVRTTTHLGAPSLGLILRQWSCAYPGLNETSWYTHPIHVPPRQGLTRHHVNRWRFIQFTPSGSESARTSYRGDTPRASEDTWANASSIRTLGGAASTHTVWTAVANRHRPPSTQRRGSSAKREIQRPRTELLLTCQRRTCACQSTHPIRPRRRRRTGWRIVLGG